jgi:multidrug efflux pump subunit AcrB
MSEADKLLAAEEASLTGRFRKIVDSYERWLHFALERPASIAILGVLLIVVLYFCYRALGTDLLPAMDEGGFVIDYIMPPGTSLQETDRVVGHIEEMVRKLPEVEGYSRCIGLQLGLAAVAEANTAPPAPRSCAIRRRGWPMPSARSRAWSTF